MNEYEVVNEKTKVSIWLKIACFIWPIVGLILFFVWKESDREKANTAIKFAVIGTVTVVAVTVITTIIGVAIGLAAAM